MFSSCFLIRRINLLVVASLFIVSPYAANAGNRAALIISNSGYEHTTKLKNPRNDVALITERLKQLGFTVRVESEVDARRFADILHEFAAELDANTDALFYYAGHGMQFRGENHLVGIDARLKNEASLQFETYRLNAVLSLLERSAGTTLLFWDACRNNPLAEDLVRSLALESTRTIAEPSRGGAAPVPPSRGDTLIVFSAEPGKIALDGRGDYSPFAESLARHLPTPNVEIETMLKRVTFDVLKTTSSVQRPERLSQLTREFYFKREDRAYVAYEEEIERLRARIASIEQAAPTKRSRLRIVATKPQKVASRDVAAVPSGGVARGGAQPIEAVKTTGSVEASDQNHNEDDLSGVLVSVNPLTAAMVRRLRFSPQGDILALGDDKGYVRLVAIDGFTVVRTISAHKDRISDLDFSPDGKSLLTAGRDGIVRYWDVDTGRMIREIKIDGSILYSARMNQTAPDRWVLMGDRKGRLYGWDLKRNRSITNHKFHDGPVHSVAYRPGGKGMLLSAGGDGEIKVRLPQGKRYSIHAHERPILQANFSASGTWLYSVGMDRKVKLWAADDLASGQPAKTLEGHLRYVLTADMSPAEDLIVSGGGDKVLNLWSVASGELIGQFKGHTHDVESVVFSPDGKLVVSASEDKTVRIWAVDDRQELARLMYEQRDAGYVGVTSDNSLFGDTDTDLLTVYVDGRKVETNEIREAAPYIGQAVSISEN